jgi:hypothetical protein
MTRAHLHIDAAAVLTTTRARTDVDVQEVPWFREGGSGTSP